MENRARLDLLMQELARELGMDEIENQEGIYTLTFDQKIIVNFATREDLDLMIMFSPVGTVDPDERAQRYAEVLGANLFHDETYPLWLALEPDSHTVVLTSRVSLATLDGTILEDWLERYLTVAEFWLDYLAGSDAGELETGHQPAPTELGQPAVQPGVHLFQA